MTRIVIRGYAAVKRHGEAVTDPAVLRTLAGLAYDDELFTEYLGGYPEEDILAGILEPGGVISFNYHEGDPLLTATTEYNSARPITPSEIQALVSYTMGQWSDGIGENLEQCPIHDEYDLHCLWSGEVVRECWSEADLREGYPVVEVMGPPEALQMWRQFVAQRLSKN